MEKRFEYTDSLNDAINSILKQADDYFLGFNNKLKEIIEREIEYAKHITGTHNYQKNNYNSSVMQYFAESIDNYKITFDMVCEWQKEMFDFKMNIINQTQSGEGDYCILSETRYDRHSLLKRINLLPNQNIRLGLKKEIPIGLCFPFSFYDNYLVIGNDKWDISKHIDIKIYKSIETWYNLFMRCGYFEDFNQRLGFIVVNVMSYLMVGKYLKIKNNG